MKSTKLFTAVATVAVLGAFAVPASAATIELAPSVGTPYFMTSIGGCSNSVLTPEADECFGVVTTPNNNLGTGADEVAAFLSGVWGISGVTGGVDDNPIDADLTLAGFQIDLGSLVSGPFAIALKQANGFSLYYYDLVATQFVTFVDNDGFGGNGNLDISHWTLYGGGTTTVPEPSSLALLGLSLVGLGLARRRRRS